MAGRRALVVGIDYYEYVSRLFGCSSDAKSVAEVLERHDDGTETKNFENPEPLIASNATEAIPAARLRSEIKDLFTHESYEIALFYFAGHGHIDSTGGFLLASDSRSGDDGVSLNDVLTLANKSRSTNRIIILDSCHSGIAGDSPHMPDTAIVKEGVSILTASTSDQYATEKNGSGIFTNLFVDALRGGASDLLGNITPGGVYAHIDQSLGVKSQRPTFKTNTKTFVSLRQVKAPVSLPELLRITDFFPEPGCEFSLDPTFEEHRSSDDRELPEQDPTNVEIFRILQKLNRTNLLVPVGADDMYWAAMRSKSCRLTALGEHYRRLVAEKLI